MPQIHGARLPRIDSLINLFYPLKHHTALQVLGCHRHQFHTLHDVITEKVVESAFYPVSLVISFLGERLFDVSSYHLLTIAQYAIQQPEQQVADEVMYT